MKHTGTRKSNFEACPPFLRLLMNRPPIDDPNRLPLLTLIRVFISNTWYLIIGNKHFMELTWISKIHEY